MTATYGTKAAFDAYIYYLALKKHFTSKSYDFIKYNGKVKASPQSFDTRKDKFFFVKLSKMPDWQSFLLANLLQNPNVWVGELVNDSKYQQIYLDWKKRQQSLSYVFKEDIGNMDDDFTSNLKVRDKQHPHLLKLYMKNRVSLETLIIIDSFTKIFDHWNEKLSDDIIWSDINMKCEKYKPFLYYDKGVLKNILCDRFA